MKLMKDNEMKIIGIGHRRNMGEDTFAEFLITILRLNYRKHPMKMEFADKLKDITYQLFFWAGHREPEYYEQNREYKEKILPLIGKSPRQLWIEIGNQLRNVHKTIWIDQLLNKDRCDILIITDLRYPNEIEAIRNKNGLCIKIERDDVEQFDDIADASLKDYEAWDVVIKNNGSLNELHKIAEQLARDLYE